MRRKRSRYGRRKHHSYSHRGKKIKKTYLVSRGGIRL